MNQQGQRKGSNFMTIILMVTTVFLGMQLINGGNNKPAETRTASDIFASIKQMSTQGKDVSIVHEIQAYDSKLSELEKSGKLTKEEHELNYAHAVVLSGYTALTAGREHNDLSRASSAWTQLEAKRKGWSTLPVWDHKFEVPGNKFVSQTSLSPRELYEMSQDEVSTRNKSDLIMGMIPGWKMIDALVALTGRQPWFSYTFAAFLLALIVRAIVFPLAQKQFDSSRQMMQLQPMILELKKKHTSKSGEVDQMGLQQDQMQLYKEYGVHPLKGCGPAFLQLPLFLIVFQCMMHYRFEFRHGFFLWINPATSAATNSFIAPNLGQMDGLLLVVYGITMVVSSYLQPITDPSQVKQQRSMGVMFAVMATVMMYFFPLPSAFVVYWIFLNIFSTSQALYSYRKPVVPLTKVQTPAGGVRSKSSFFNKLIEAQENAYKNLEQQKQADAEKAAQDKKGNNSSDNKKGNGTSANGSASNGEASNGHPQDGKLYKPKTHKKR